MPLTQYNFKTEKLYLYTTKLTGFTYKFNFIQQLSIYLSKIVLIHQKLNYLGHSRVQTEEQTTQSENFGSVCQNCHG